MSSQARVLSCSCPFVFLQISGSSPAFPASALLPTWPPLPKPHVETVHLPPHSTLCFLLHVTCLPCGSHHLTSYLFLCLSPGDQGLCVQAGSLGPRTLWGTYRGAVNIEYMKKPTTTKNECVTFKDDFCGNCHLSDWTSHCRRDRVYLMGL